MKCLIALMFVVGVIALGTAEQGCAPLSTANTMSVEYFDSEANPISPQAGEVPHYAKAAVTCQVGYVTSTGPIGGAMCSNGDWGANKPECNPE